MYNACNIECKLKHTVMERLPEDLLVAFFEVRCILGTNDITPPIKII